MRRALTGRDTPQARPSAALEGTNTYGTFCRCKAGTSSGEPRKGHCPAALEECWLQQLRLQDGRMQPPQRLHLVLRQQRQVQQNLDGLSVASHDCKAGTVTPVHCHGCKGTHTRRMSNVAGCWMHDPQDCKANLPTNSEMPLYRTQPQHSRQHRDGREVAANSTSLSHTAMARRSGGSMSYRKASKELQQTCSASSWLQVAGSKAAVSASWRTSLRDDMHGVAGTQLENTSNCARVCTTACTFVGALLELLVVGSLLHDVQDGVRQLPEHTNAAR